MARSLVATSLCHILFFQQKYHVVSIQQNPTMAIVWWLTDLVSNSNNCESASARYIHCSNYSKISWSHDKQLQVSFFLQSKDILFQERHSSYLPSFSEGSSMSPSGNAANHGFSTLMCIPVFVTWYTCPKFLFVGDVCLTCNVITGSPSFQCSCQIRW